MRRALITGITGQDGSYLAEFLLRKGYEVHGIVRRVAIEDPNKRLWRIRHLLNKVVLHPASIENFGSVLKVMMEVKPNEVYHLAAQSFVAESFIDPFTTIHINTVGTLNMLEAIKHLKNGVRFYNAASSEMFGEVKESPQNENTPFNPRSPYGVSKVAGYDLTRNYRESYNMFACSGILFNHESPRRGFEFVTRKITYNAALIYHNLADSLSLGNISAKRDWGHSIDYVRAMWLMLQQDTPEDFVIATGETNSVETFLEIAFTYFGLDWQDYVVVDQKYMRPADVELLVGDCTRAKEKLRWSTRYNFEQLVVEMCDADSKGVGYERK